MGVDLVPLAAGSRSGRAAARFPRVEIARCEASRVIDLRARVLRARGASEEMAFIEDADPESIHLAAEVSGAGVVGCVSYLVSTWEGWPAWRLRGMAVADSHRRRGIGSRLLAAMDAELAAIGDARPLAWCTARLSAVGFYERMGWAAASTPFINGWAGPSIVMIERRMRTLDEPFAA